MTKRLNYCIIIILLAMLNIIEASCKKAGEVIVPAPVPALPVLTSTDVNKERGLTTGAMRFYVNLSAAAKADATVQYTIVDGTAKAAKDFTNATATVTIAAGQTLGYFDIPIIGDSLRQPNLQFSVQFNNPVNCTLGTTSVVGTINTMDLSYLPTDDGGYTTPLTYPGYTLAWSDEFSGTAINTSNWNFETGGSGFGNHELEYYTVRSQNAFQSNGKLIIEARSELFGGNKYTSARMTSQGKKVFTYGRIDIRAKLPVAKGMWPALWMLGANIATLPWPACGEIDIMELVGSDPNKVVGTGHFANNAGTHDQRGGNYSLAAEDFAQHFHVFSIVWKKDSIQWLMDNQVYYTMTNANTGTNNYPFNNNFFFILNVAVGGDWPGAPDATTNFPQRMFVDYVRVFQ